MTGRPLLSSTLQTRLATIVARTHDRRCRIERPLVGRDAGGAPLTGWTVVGEVDCRVDTSNRMANEGRFGPSTPSVGDAELGMPVGVPLVPSDRVTVQGGLGETWEVISVSPATETYQVETVAAVRRAT